MQHWIRPSLRRRNTNQRARQCSFQGTIQWTPLAAIGSGPRGGSGGSIWQRLQEPENQGHCGGLRLGPGVHADRPTSSHGFCRSEAADLGCLRSEPRLSTSDQRPKFADPPRAVGSPFTASAATHLRRDQSSQFQKSGLRYRTGFRLVRTPVRPAGPRLVSRSRRSQIVDQGSDAEISVEHVRPMFL